ncbi:hypothetical protein LAWI1_G006675 [Lachnellula willkommii]|uniref:Uncharacterized protein n=1 Tax=Lachnellula willkommii TaxID=215461 RepID=A0A559LYM6_9HELO|nr:hypothetical protein LAWI1_G006675 [Lachnellula willkommii]
MYLSPPSPPGILLPPSSPSNTTPLSAKAVAQLDNLQFLEDVVPRTVPFKEIKAKKTSAAGPSHSHAVANGEGSGNVESGQTTLDSKQFAVANGTNGDAESLDDGDNDPNTQLEMESRGARLSTGSAGLNGQEDVEMS